MVSRWVRTLLISLLFLVVSSIAHSLESSKNNVILHHDSSLIQPFPGKTLVIGTVDGVLVGIDEKNGKEKWVLDTEEPLFSNHVETTQHMETNIYVPSIDGTSNVFSVSLRKEKVERLPFSVRQFVENSPLYSGDSVYIGNKETHVFAIEPNSGTLFKTFSTKLKDLAKSYPFDTPKGTIFVGRIDYRIHVVDLMTGNEKWNISAGEWIPSNFLEENGENPWDCILFSDVLGTLYCLDSDSKTVKWTYKPPSRVIAAYRISNKGNLMPVELQNYIQESNFAMKKKSHEDPTVYIGQSSGGFLFAMENLTTFPLVFQDILPSQIAIKGNSDFSQTGEIALLSSFQSGLDGCVFRSFNFEIRDTNVDKMLPSTQPVVVVEHTGSDVFFPTFLLIPGSLIVFSFFFLKMNQKAKAFLGKENAQKGKRQKKRKTKNLSSQAFETEFVHVGQLTVNLKKILGYGSCGTIVFEGWLGKRKVAVKRLLVAFYDIAEREISHLIHADTHKNVVTYFCKEQDAEFVYIALTFCPMTLANFVENHDYTIEDALKIIYGIASGIIHIHSLHIVHRDIKPQNILISNFHGEGNIPMISDMGVAKKLNQNQSSFSAGSSSVGTVGWQAPEALRSEKKRITKKVDVFSFGCVLFYVLTKGNHAFGDHFEREGRILKGNHDLALIRDNPEAQHLVQSCICYDCDNRWDIRQVISHPFFWDDHTKLQFLKDASDALEFEKPTSEFVQDLQQHSEIICDNHWMEKIDQLLLDNLGKYRKYETGSVRDLLRVIRNKAHHYRDLDENLKHLLGPLPSGYLKYFTHRFPNLLMRTYETIGQFRRKEHVFQRYYGGLQFKKIIFGRQKF